jgi:hypothetical protein
MVRTLGQRWPLTPSDRAQLAQFVAVHIVRTGAFRAFLERVTDEAIKDSRHEERLGTEQVRAAAKIFRGDRMHANALLGQIGRVAGLLCSLQRSLTCESRSRDGRSGRARPRGIEERYAPERRSSPLRGA